MKLIASLWALAVLGNLSPVPHAVTAQELVTIVGIGDATTAGAPGSRPSRQAPPGGRDEAENQYPYWLRRANPAWRVLNRGVAGQRADEIRSRFKTDVLDLRPDLVIIIAGVNDIAQGRPANDVKADLQAMYDLAKGAGIPVVAGAIVPLDAATPQQTTAVADVNAWIGIVAGRDPNLTFVDTAAAGTSSGSTAGRAGSPDEIRSSPEGHRRLADVLRPGVEAALAGRRRP
jgi:lysophospholipase L1-like esterase